MLRHVGYLKHQQQVDLLTLKVVSESRVTWATSVPILVFLGLSVLELGPMYATDVRQTHRLMLPPYGGGGIIKPKAKGSSRSSVNTSSWLRITCS